MTRPPAMPRCPLPPPGYVALSQAVGRWAAGLRLRGLEPDPGVVAALGGWAACWLEWRDYLEGLQTWMGKEA